MSPNPQIEVLLSLAWNIEAVPDAGEIPRRAALIVEKSRGRSQSI
jgi:hypothetical protein